jgi:hypothetical protein
MARLEVSDIARSIKGRIREVEEQLKDHKALSDELERLKGALSRLEGGVRSRVDGRRRPQRPVTQRTTAPAPKDTSRSTNARAPSLPSSCETASAVGLLSLRARTDVLSCRSSHQRWIPGRSWMAPVEERREP